MGNNDVDASANETPGPVAGEALKDAARWPGYGLIALGLVATAMSLAGYAVGRNVPATVAAIVAVLALAAGLTWQFVEHWHARTRHGSGTPERPEDAAPLR